MERMNEHVFLGLVLFFISNGCKYLLIVTIISRILSIDQYISNEQKIIYLMKLLLQ